MRPVTTEIRQLLLLATTVMRYPLILASTLMLMLDTTELRYVLLLGTTGVKCILDLDAFFMGYNCNEITDICTSVVICVKYIYFKQTQPKQGTDLQIQPSVNLST